MPRASTKSSASRGRKRSPRRPRYEDPLTRAHHAGRKLAAERKRLGMTRAEYLHHIHRENERMMAEFRTKNGE